VFGLDILGVSSVLMLVSNVVQVCHRAPPPPQIAIHIEERPVSFDTGRTKRELAEAEINHGSGFLRSFHADVGGLTDGQMNLDQQITFARRLDRGSGFGCVHFDKIEITITLDPSIYIAREYEQDECMFKEVFEHELMHVEVDRAIMEDYRGLLADGLRMVYDRPSEYASGVITESQMDGVQQRMKVDMERAIRVLFNRMQEDRAQRQAAVDTPEEYARILYACAGSGL